LLDLSLHALEVLRRERLRSGRQRWLDLSGDLALCLRASTRAFGLLGNFRRFRLAATGLCGLTGGVDLGLAASRFLSPTGDFGLCLVSSCLFGLARGFRLAPGLGLTLALRLCAPLCLGFLPASIAIDLLCALAGDVRRDLRSETCGLSLSGPGFALGALPRFLRLA
jgi:hypothetical protein